MPTPITDQNKSSQSSLTDMHKSFQMTTGEFDVGTFDFAQFDVAPGIAVEIVVPQPKHSVTLTDIPKH